LRRDTKKANDRYTGKGKGKKGLIGVLLSIGKFFPLKYMTEERRWEMGEYSGCGGGGGNPSHLKGSAEAGGFGTVIQPRGRKRAWWGVLKRKRSFVQCYGVNLA